MTLHPEIERSDDNEGAYSTDEPISFCNLTNSTTESSGQSESPADLSGDNSAESNPNTNVGDGAEGSGMASRPTTSPSGLAEKRKRLADVVAHQHVDSGPDQTLASTSVDGVAGKCTTFHFCTMRISETTCYYILQRTITGDRIAGVTTAVKDVGTDWDYRIPTIDGNKLNEAIQDARYCALRQGDEPIAFLSDEQIDAVQREYNRQVEKALNVIEDAVGTCRPDVYLFAQFAVIDVSEIVFRAELQGYLSDRQLDIVQDTLLTAVWEDLGGAQCRRYGVTDAPMECPIAVELEFDL